MTHVSSHILKNVMRHFHSRPIGEKRKKTELVMMYCTEPLAQRFSYAMCNSDSLSIWQRPWKGTCIGVFDSGLEMYSICKVMKDLFDSLFHCSVPKNAKSWCVRIQWDFKFISASFPPKESRWKMISKDSNICIIMYFYQLSVR